MGAGCLGCLGALALLVGGLAGVALYLTHGPVDAVQHQIRDVKRGDLRAGYERLAEGYRQELSFDDFGALVRAHPALERNQGSLFWERVIDGERARVSGRLTGVDGRSERVSYALAREGGEWRITGIRFGGNEE